MKSKRKVLKEVKNDVKSLYLKPLPLYIFYILEEKKGKTKDLKNLDKLIVNNC